MGHDISAYRVDDAAREAVYQSIVGEGQKLGGDEWHAKYTIYKDQVEVAYFRRMRASLTRARNRNVMSSSILVECRASEARVPGLNAKDQQPQPGVTLRSWHRPSKQSVL